MKILTAQDVHKALPMQAAIEATKNAYAALSAGRAAIPLRTHLPIPPEDAAALFMPAYLQNPDAEDALAIKIVNLFPNNPAKNLAFIQAAVLVLDAKTGQTRALLEGSSLTAIRTGAASGAATDILARLDSRVAVIFGAGIQGRTQLEAVCSVREIEQVWIVDTDPQRAQTFVDEMRGQGVVPDDVRIAPDPKLALSNADIVCTATTAVKPVYQAADLKPGTHINGVGSYTLEMVENPPKMLLNASIFIDEKEASLAEAGEIHAAMRDFDLPENALKEIGEVLLGNLPSRQSPEEITFFKSVGVAVQDAAAAQLALQNAEAMGLGQDVDF